MQADRYARSKNWSFVSGHPRDQNQLKGILHQKVYDTLENSHKGEIPIVKKCMEFFMYGNLCRKFATCIFSHQDICILNLIMKKGKFAMEK